MPGVVNVFQSCYRRAEYVKMLTEWATGVIKLSGDGGAKMLVTGYW